VCLALTGCSENSASLGTVVVMAMALPLVAYAFHALGRLQGQRAAAAELRASRQALRAHGEVDDAWFWQSDAQHRLVVWRAPGHTPGDAAAAQAALGPALQAQLQSQRSFAALDVQADDTAALGSRAWRLSGSPCLDEEGRFEGYLGRAHPLDATRRLEAAAASLDAVLAASGNAALACDEGEGFVLQQLSPTAAATWPAARPGQTLAEALPGLPAGVSAVLADMHRQPAGTTLDVAGWRLLRFPAGPGRTCLWLGQVPAATDSAAASTEAEQFSMTVSHDLRAPIRVVEGFTRIVKEDYGQLLDRVGNDHLDRVLGAAARMNLMIDALLTLARLSTQPLARQPVNLSQLAGYVVEDLRRSAPEREADIEIEPGLTAQGDPTLLRLVLENLLGNAWKYTGRAARAHIVLRQINEGGQRSFLVQDNGAGFDMRSADRLFGLFQRLHSASDFPGHGVGLASVKRIVQRHGGDIWAEAEPGRGASFHFTLA
jgi:signal transduction histidine kinase